MRLFRVRGLRQLLTDKLLSEHFPDDQDIQPNDGDLEGMVNNGYDMYVEDDEVLIFVDETKM